MTNSNWKAAAWTILLKVCRTHQRFTTDNIWKACGKANIDPPPEPKVMGHIMADGRRAGWCRPTEEPRFYSTRSACNRRPLTVWISMVYNKVDQGRKKRR